jgi:LysR family transcriptional activator of nhaA
MKVWLNYHHLFYFWTIAEEGSIAKASEKLSLGQPTLSAQLKQFEDQLGVKLFERKPKALSLTEHGQIVFQYAKQIFDLGHELLDTLRDQKTKKVQLQLGALDVIPKSLVANLVQSVTQKFHCRVMIEEGDQNQLFEALKSFQLDCVICDFIPTQKEHSRLKSTPILQTEIGFYGLEKYLIKERLNSSIDSEADSLQNIKVLEEAPLLLPARGSWLRYEIDKYFNKKGIKQNILAESLDSSCLKKMAEAGLGIYPFPLKLDPYETEHLKLVYHAKEIHQDFYLLSQERRVKNPALDHLIKSLSYLK